jgi:putative transcriptional regulator
MKRTSKSKQPQLETQGLAGQFLIAMPGMTDKRFQRTVIYMFLHNSEHAMGLIVNRRSTDVSFSELLEHLELQGQSKVLETAELADRVVHFGGPVSTSRGFVLHSPDYQTTDRTMVVDKSVCLTATVDILQAMAQGKGPSRSLLALGYAGWAAGQLENEISANGWLHCRSHTDILFDPDIEEKYERALKSLGVSPGHLVAEAGHA